jgi:ferrous iron transport protein A
MMHIDELIPGDVARLVDYGTTEHIYRRRLMSLGLTLGVLFLVVRKAPLGCPILIEVRGTALSLRQDEAGALIVERL